MSQTKYKKFTGFIGWNHLVEPDDYLGQTKWKMDFYPDDLAGLKDMGCKLRPKSDEKGEYVRPTCETERTFKKDGEDVLTQLKAPKVTYPDGTLFDMRFVPKGSRVEVNLAFYNAGKYGVGTRLLDVAILELAEEEARAPATENQEIEAAEEVSTKEIPAPKTGKKKLPF